MNHANMYAVGLALCTFADIASEEMSRDLANEIEKLLGSSNTYIRKKVRLFMIAVKPFPTPSPGGSLCTQGSPQSARTIWSFRRQSEESPR